MDSIVGTKQVDIFSDLQRRQWAKTVERVGSNRRYLIITQITTNKTDEFKQSLYK